MVSVLGRSFGVCSASSTDDLEGLVRASEAAAQAAEPASDFGSLIAGPADASFGDEAEVASPAIFAALAVDLGVAFGALRGDGLALYGYASHDVTTPPGWGPRPGCAAATSSRRVISS